LLVAVIADDIIVYIMFLLLLSFIHIQYCWQRFLNVAIKIKLNPCLIVCLG